MGRLPPIWWQHRWWQIDWSCV